MTTTKLFIGRRSLDLVKRIGKGGEGEVYLLGGAQKKAIKIYTGAPNSVREAKVRAMVHEGLARSLSLVAFPEEIVTTRTGQFAGFSMQLVEGFREIHELYGPKSRKIHFPKADFRFLVRAAANAARAVGQVHSSQCVIGDLNEQGLLVSTEAIVALIDADSFQFENKGKVYPCLVGKADFTAPELQGKSLAGARRIKAHDHFSLAVTIFQLLFMGRHPYAGVLRGADLSQEQMIAANLFAYSRKRQTGVTPPGILPSLDDFPADIGDGFERAFGLDPTKRPTAAEWVNLLQGLETRLSRCTSNPVHFYPTSAKTCPWCRVEGATGAVLFFSTTISNFMERSGIGNFDVEKAWAAIKGVILPDPKTVMPRLQLAPTQPSEKAKSAKKGNLNNKLLGAAIAIATITAWVKNPEGGLIWIGSMIFAFFQFNKPTFDSSVWKNSYSIIEARWDKGIAAWRDALDIPNIIRLRSELETSISEYRSLAAKKTQAIARLKNERHERQLNDYLDRFLIRSASISGIGQAKMITLASFGIESAADINRNSILAIPGFGPVTADKLMAWRAQHVQRFVYNPAPNPGDLAAQAKLEADFVNRAESLASKISVGQGELLLLTNKLRQRLATEDIQLNEIAAERAQIEADLMYLGVAKPKK